MYIFTVVILYKNAFQQTNNMLEVFSLLFLYVTDNKILGYIIQKLAKILVSVNTEKIVDFRKMFFCYKGLAGCPAFPR